MDEKKAVTMNQLLESARQSEALAMQVAQKAQEELEKKQGKLIGSEGQVVGFDAKGQAVARSTESLRGPKGETGDTGATGPQGPAGAAGQAGPGLPTGGTVGQVPAKASSTNYHTQWVTPVGKSLAGQSVEPTSGTTVTAKKGAEIFNDYSDRLFSGTTAMFGNVSCGYNSHAEGSGTTASGDRSHAEGSGTTASGDRSHAEGEITTASGSWSHAEGRNTMASGEGCHAEGFDTVASLSGDHAEGRETKASGTDSHTEGRRTTASGVASHAEGIDTIANGAYAHAEGESTTASGSSSHAEGYYTIASGQFQHVCGSYNVEYTSESSRVIVGKGNSNGRANCFRVTNTGTYAAGSYNASGADYAELFEWADGNPAGEDRAGRFVTLTGDKLRLAGPGDSYILGIVSGNPSIIGDVHDDQWAGMYLYDVFGRPLWEDVEVPDKTVEEPDPEHPGQTVTRVIRSAHTEHRQQLNPAYDGTKPYTARTERPEWDAVGLMGKLVAVDDGTCQVDGYCTVGEGGGATASEQRTRYRVMKRLDGNHVQVMVLP